jgi:hypothetical protein
VLKGDVWPVVLAVPLAGKQPIVRLVPELNLA